MSALARRQYGSGSIYLRGKIWYISYFVDGKAFNESSKSTSWDDAEALLVERMHEKQRFQRLSASLSVGWSTSMTGAAAELLVAADLMSKGVYVFRALSAQCCCDLVGIKDGKTVRFEVKTSSLKKNGEHGVNLGYQKELHDVLAVVDRKLGIKYFPALRAVFTENLPENLQQVPGRPEKRIQAIDSKRADVAELADALDLGSYTYVPALPRQESRA